MPVGKPGKVLFTNVPLKFVQKKVTGHGGKSLDASIPLVPFIDFLITLVVFLLMSFSASGELLAQVPNLKMPTAGNVKNLEPGIAVIAINADVITVGGTRVENTRTVAQDAQIRPIDGIVQYLEQEKRKYSLIHPGKVFQGEVILQADENVDYRVIKKVMFSAAQAGYANINFAVNNGAAAE